MSAHYGYIRRTEGKDDEQVDVYLASDREDTPVFVVDQVDPKAAGIASRKRSFDEHKVVLGAASREEAETVYDAAFSDGSGPSRRQVVTELPMEGFKAWLKDGDTKKPIASQKLGPVTPDASPTPATPTDIPTLPAGASPGPSQEAVLDQPELPPATEVRVPEPVPAPAEGPAHRDIALRALRAWPYGVQDAMLNSTGPLHSAGELEGGDKFRLTNDRKRLKVWKAGEREKDAKTFPIEAIRKQIAAEPETQERRTDTDRRKRIAEMSREEIERELLTSALTGLHNRRAYEDAERLPIQVSIDADSLKWVNDHMTHGSGDKLLAAIGSALGAEAAEAYHFSGDEFVVQAESEQAALKIMATVNAKLGDAVITAESPDGSRITLNGLGVSYGIGSTLEEADRALAEHKQQRQAAGLRAARGEQPPGAVKTPPERKPDRGGKAAAEEGVAETPVPAGVPTSAERVVDALRKSQGIGSMRMFSRARELLPDMPKSEFDAAVLELREKHGPNAMLPSDQSFKGLDPRDQAAFVEDKNNLSRWGKPSVYLGMNLEELPAEDAPKPTPEAQPEKAAPQAPTEAEVDAQLAKDSAALEAERNRAGRIEQMVVEKAKRELAAGRIDQDAYDRVIGKYGAAASQYTSEAAKEKASKAAGEEPTAKAEAKPTKEKPAKPIDDVGEKIGGARKDLWRERGLRLADLEGMSGGEEAQYVTKENVWPAIDYPKLIADGATPQAAALIKIIRDRLAKTPKKDTPEGRRHYVEVIGIAREELEKAKTAEDVKAVGNAVFSRIGWYKENGWRDDAVRSESLLGLPGTQQSVQRGVEGHPQGRQDDRRGMAGDEESKDQDASGARGRQAARAPAPRSNRAHR